MLKLQGHFSYIDNYNKLKFLFIDDDTKEKLERACGGTNKPFTYEGFTVGFKHNTKVIPDDIQSLVGLKCTIWVKPRPYNFVSKSEHNFGEKISGVTLTLDDISRL